MDESGRDPGAIWRILTSKGGQTTLLVALLGQATTAIYFQITNNERQDAAIAANALAISEWVQRDQNLNTSFGQRFIKLHDMVDEMIKRIDTLQTPLGQRFLVLEAKTNDAIALGMDRVRQTERLAENIQIMSERVNTIDRRLLEIEINAKKDREKGKAK